MLSGTIPGGASVLARFGSEFSFYLPSPLDVVYPRHRKPPFGDGTLMGHLPFYR